MSLREATLLYNEEVHKCSRLVLWWPTIKHASWLSFCLYPLPYWLGHVTAVDQWYKQTLVHWGLLSWNTCLKENLVLEASHHYSVQSLAIHMEENSGPDQQPQLSSQMLANTDLSASHTTVSS